MPTEIEIEVGDLYESLHVQFAENIGDEYDQALRQQVENFLHNYNQQLDRQMEQQDEIEIEPEEE